MVRVSGYVSAGALLVGTILYLLDATNALGVNNYTPTGRSQIANEAGYWVAQFAHQRDIMWDVIARDTLFPLAFLGIHRALARRPGQTGTPYAVFSLATGAVVGPIVAIWLGHHLGAAGTERAEGPVPAAS